MRYALTLTWKQPAVNQAIGVDVAHVGMLYETRAGLLFVTSQLLQGSPSPTSRSSDEVSNASTEEAPSP